MSEQAQTIAITVWLLGWAGATLFAATVIGNIPNRPGEQPRFPTFLWPLIWGWVWPVLLAGMLVIGPLGWLSDRATRRAGQKDPPQ